MKRTAERLRGRISPGVHVRCAVWGGDRQCSFTAQVFAEDSDFGVCMAHAAAKFGADWRDRATERKSIFTVEVA